MRNSILVIIVYTLVLMLSRSVNAQENCAQYQKVNSSGLDIYYRIFGDGTPILIIGGGPGDSSDRYLSLCNLLSREFKCILVEQRGCGKSSPQVYDSTTISVSLTLEDFEEIRKELELEQWAVLGFSYGGHLASIYTHFYPESVSSLILLGSLGLNTNAFPHFVDNITSKLHEEDLELFEYWNDSTRVAADPHHALVERIRARMPGYFYDRKKSLLVSQTMKDSDFNFEVGQWIWSDVVKRNLDLTLMDTKFNGPVLVLHGRQDPLGESVPQELARYYSNSNLVFIERAGHYSWIEQPEMIFSSVKEFLSNNK